MAEATGTEVVEPIVHDDDKVGDRIDQILESIDPETLEPVKAEATDEGPVKAEEPADEEAIKAETADEEPVKAEEPAKEETTDEEATQADEALPYTSLQDFSEKLEAEAGISQAQFLALPVTVGEKEVPLKDALELANGVPRAMEEAEQRITKYKDEHTAYVSGLAMLVNHLGQQASGVSYQGQPFHPESPQAQQLRQQDYATYARLKEDWDAGQSQLQTMINQASQEAEKVMFQRYHESHMEALRTIPGYSDQVRDTFVLPALAQMGFTSQHEQQAMYQPGIVRMMVNTLGFMQQFEAMKAELAQLKGEAKSQPAPGRLTNLKPGKRTAGPADQREKKARARQAFEKDPNDSDAFDRYLATLADEA